MTEIGVLRPCRENEVVEWNTAVSGEDFALADVDARDLRQHHRCIALAVENGPDRRCDVRGRAAVAT